MSKKSKGGAAGLKPFDKYDYYHRSVQAPDTDVEFLRDTYKEIRGSLPAVMREDFCGTFAVCCEWVKLGPKFQAHGVDLDPEPIEYGKSRNMEDLTLAQKARIELHWANVLESGLPRADVVCALNFSYYIFKQRSTMLTYFKNALATLNPNGLFVIDCFGGSRCFEANEEETEHRTHTYYWDQVSFDPVTNEAMFYIHFKPKGQKKIEKVFTYDWRMWTIPELRELMNEAGFQKTFVYWEGTTRNGEGDGNFKQTEKGEECEAWIAYVVGAK